MQLENLRELWNGVAGMSNVGMALLVHLIIESTESSDLRDVIRIVRESRVRVFTETKH